VLLSCTLTPIHWLLALVQALVLCACAYAQPATIPIQFNITLQKMIVTQHEPVILVLEFGSPSPQSVVVDLGYNSEKLHITVVDPDGVVVNKTNSVEGPGATYSFHIDGESKSSGAVPLTDWFTFDKVGNYEIDVDLGAHSASYERFSYTMVGNRAKLNITVRPRDEAALRQVCDQLLSHAEDLPYDSQEKWVAARALAKVNDPVAVPFMVRALNQRNFARLMIPALARIKTADAIAALESATGSPDKETQSLAHSALASLGRAQR